MSRMSQAQITLVGAGPGDPELISIAGVKALRQADVVLFDALVDPALLSWAIKAEKIFVGKRKGYKRYTQNQINQLMVSKAFERGHVVRLKGGDPFIFGRGSEELEFVESFGIPTRIIPGISSSTSAAASQGIPLTRRGIAQSFWVLTATTKEGELAKDIALAAQSTATIVILMGMSKLNSIVQIFEKLGKEQTPVCIIQNAFRPDEKYVTATMESILSKVQKHRVANPAVIVIGEVVRYGSEDINELIFQQVITHKAS